MVTLIVNNNRVGPIRGRHPWVFSGALRQIPNGITSGEPIRLTDEAGHFLACGYFNSYSQIAVRVWGWEAGEEVNEEFFAIRIKSAFELRKNFVLNKTTDSCRIVNSESDLLPGLIVDKYADYLVVQFHNRGIDRWKLEIVSALKKVIKPKGIYERSDVGGRSKEQQNVILNHPNCHPERSPKGAVEGSLSVGRGRVDSSTSGVYPERSRMGSTQNDSVVGLLAGKIPAQITITENGYKFLVDVKTGQKTGFFLDQRDKRSALQKYCEGKNVLNCFSYTGGFSVYALAAGAKKVVSVDSSQSALDLARENIKLNKLDIKKCDFICEDVKKFFVDCHPREGGDLPRQVADSRLHGNGNVFDVIILDPPAFIKDRHKIHEGMQGYKKINEAAMRLLPHGGILVSASCSQHLSLTDFRYLLSESAGRAGRTLQILETYTHGIDHPQLVSFTDGEYLKCVFAKVS